MSGAIFWILAVYLLVLSYFTVHKDRWHSAEPLRAAWKMFAWIPMMMALFSLIKAGNFPDSRDMLLTEIWQNGLAWLFLGISVFRLAGLLDDSQSKGV